MSLPARLVVGSRTCWPTGATRGVCRGRGLGRRAGAGCGRLPCPGRPAERPVGLADAHLGGTLADKEPNPFMSRLFLLALGSLILVAPAASAGETAEELFSRQVWPLLQARCQACHGDEPKL